MNCSSLPYKDEIIKRLEEAVENPQRYGCPEDRLMKGLLKQGEMCRFLERFIVVCGGSESLSVLAIPLFAFCCKKSKELFEKIIADKESYSFAERLFPPDLFHFIEDVAEGRVAKKNAEYVLKLVKHVLEHERQ